MLPVLRSEQAEKDLDEILSDLDERSPRAAERLSAAMDERIERLGRFPLMGRARDELAVGLRSIVVESYIVFYRVQEDAVVIVRLLHGARDIDTIMKADGE